VTPDHTQFFIACPSPHGDKLSISTSVPSYQFTRLKETAPLRGHGQGSGQHLIEGREECPSLSVRRLSSQPISDRQIADRVLFEAAVYFVHDRGLGTVRFVAQRHETPPYMFRKSTDKSHRS
jgi:hypothetical protein